MISCTRVSCRAWPSRMRVSSGSSGGFLSSASMRLPAAGQPVAEASGMSAPCAWPGSLGFIYSSGCRAMSGVKWQFFHHTPRGHGGMCALPQSARAPEQQRAQHDREDREPDERPLRNRQAEYRLIAGAAQAVGLEQDGSSLAVGKVLSEVSSGSMPQEIAGCACTHMCQPATPAPPSAVSRPRPAPALAAPRGSSANTRHSSAIAANR